MKLALSILCENPFRRTGLSTLFPELVKHSLQRFPDLDWIVFAGPNQEWRVLDPRVEVVRDFPANDHLLRRLWADHFRVAPAARERSAQALITTGFAPLRAPLPIVMQVFSVPRKRLPANVRELYRSCLLRRGLRHSQLVIVNSQWTARQLDLVMGVSPVRRCVSPEGIQHERFRVDPDKKDDEAAKALKLPERYLLWASNFYAYKRAKLTLAAYARLTPALRRRFPLVLVGGDWQGGAELAKAEARNLGIAEDCRFLGWVSDDVLPVCYRRARALVLSTAEETFGRSVLEAMACGCPCVIQDLPVFREIANDAVCLVDFAAADAAAEALVRVCTDDTFADTLRTRGVRCAAQYHFPRLVEERIGAIYQAFQGARE